ncbi:CPBP family intramembrane glutamic endopeptidase [Streptococcus dysgalactiae]|uniref:CPBP family intramembrane glutamic endopeptidase n=1 Tax=Streptococcus dysgalactiae TaxID=1334 RepID=UPI0001F866C7|nr:type II CAAX endopeptidase family protein [Streptococcus dysgalactiae]EFY02844.1 putative CAAX amino terminal protease family protein [Streptococcus dysgalactiae subsp. dysgalactiae ATCC 27957]MCB2830390.1 CPBP family intramembrane metalloprotease [Streptococcus dysgalactiae subsp. dysgalactiae]MCB2836093.1 CPBP family intramembrane metalloprotease [Streptococcus dysgalactiae subsp. dysgalactiae]MCB2840078.1 CPBP family intramembrane metalloprotease [Streptococcus dysgalactiae subsp. dysgala
MRKIVNKKDYYWAAGALIALFLGAFIWGILFGFIFRNSASITLSVMIGGSISSLIVLWYGYSLKNNWSLSDFGFHKGKHSLWHLLWWIPLTFIFSIAGAGLFSFLFKIPHEAKAGGISSETMALGWAVVLVIELTVGILIPFIEEIIFRRFLFEWLQLYFSKWLAASIVVFVFTVLHIIPAVMAYVLFLGISLMLSRIWFQNLTAPWLIHTINNSLVVLIATLS